MAVLSNVAVASGRRPGAPETIRLPSSDQLHPVRSGIGGEPVVTFHF